MASRAPEVTVIGAGIVGAATAYYLARGGVRVQIVEKGLVAGEQSGRNWGFVRRQGRDPVEIPLARRANQIYAHLEEELGQPVGWVQGGNLRIADGEEQLQKYREWLAETGGERTLGTKIVSRREIETLLPAMRAEWPGGMFTATDGHADPERATRGFVAAAQDAGATLRTGTAVRSIEVDRGRVAAVTTSDGDIPTGVVVCAAGIWTSRLLRPLGLQLPVRWVRATVAITKPLPALTSMAVWTPSVAFRQREDGSVVLGTGGTSDYDISLESFRFVRQFLPNYLANRKLFRLNVGRLLLEDVWRHLPLRETDPFTWERLSNPPANRSKVRRSLAAFASLFPSLPPPALAEAWAAYIDATPDAIPVIGAVDGIDNLFVATGFSGHGFGLGPAVGKVMGELILDGAPSLDLRPFRLERFAEGGRARPRSVT